MRVPFEPQCRRVIRRWLPQEPHLYCRTIPHCLRVVLQHLPDCPPQNPLYCCLRVNPLLRWDRPPSAVFLRAARWALRFLHRFARGQALRPEDCFLLFLDLHLGCDGPQAEEFDRNCFAGPLSTMMAGQSLR